MKFSYSLIKQFLKNPPSKKEAIDGLNLHSFEAQDLKGDAIDISIPPNRYSDAASAFGIAKELAAIFNLKLIDNFVEIINPPSIEKIKVEVKDPDICQRYQARVFEFKQNKKNNKLKINFKKFLKSSGLNSINPIVDIMNYVMLEVGQPMHAFDFDKLSQDSKIIVRRAKNGEKIELLDGQKITLDKDTLLIADSNGPLAIAGIKGGKRAEITNKTKKIVVESANFDGSNILKTSKRLKIVTDASLRFSHDLSPALTNLAMDRATILLNKLGGVLIDSYDYYKNPKEGEIIAFNVDKFNHFIGSEFNKQTIIKDLKKLGFKIVDEVNKNKNDSADFYVQVPILRQDISSFEDLAEEIIRLEGYNSLKPKPPIISATFAKEEDIFIFKDKIRNILIGFGFDEVYNYSFLSDKQLSQKKDLIFLENPISSDLNVLRPSLEIGLTKNLSENLKFYSEVKIFEIGKVFKKPNLEYWNLGISMVGDKEKFSDLKGVVNKLLSELGLAEFEMIDMEKYLRIEVDNLVLGKLKIFDLKGKKAVYCEIEGLEKLMNLCEEVKEFEPLPKYPYVIRDISFLVDSKYKIGDIMETISLANVKLIENVEFLDEFIASNDDSRHSLTFRLIFRADNRTLTKEEVDSEMKKIIKILEEKYFIELR